MSGSKIVRDGPPAHLEGLGSDTSRALWYVSGTSQFEVRLLRARSDTPAESWAVFRFASGEVLVSPTFLIPNFKWSIEGRRVCPGQFYPPDYLFKEISSE